MLSHYIHHVRADRLLQAAGAPRYAKNIVFDLTNIPQSSSRSMGPVEIAMFLDSVLDTPAGAIISYTHPEASSFFEMGKSFRKIQPHQLVLLTTLSSQLHKFNCQKRPTWINRVPSGAWSIIYADWNHCRNPHRLRTRLSSHQSPVSALACIGFKDWDCQLRHWFKVLNDPHSHAFLDVSRAAASYVASVVGPDRIFLGSHFLSESFLFSASLEHVLDIMSAWQHFTTSPILQPVCVPRSKNFGLVLQSAAERGLFFIDPIQ